MKISANSDKVKVIFGLKIRQLRFDKKLSLSEVSEKSGLSISYLNEIEKGKKYPKTEKIMALSEALEIDYDSLVSLRLSKKLEPISDFLNSNILTQLPLEIFGVDPADFISLMSEAPAKISAFISTITQISRHYDIDIQKFYFSVLRSYKEMYDNYFPEIEAAAQEFRKVYGIANVTSPNASLLGELLVKEFGYSIETFTKDSHPDLFAVRSFYNVKSNKLFVNSDLSPEQLAFTYARELGYQFLKIKKRICISSALEVKSFEEVLNNFRASYFAGAILINKDILIDRLTYFFANPKWDGNMLISIMKLFNATTEVFMQRLTNLITSHFKINNLFFIRFNNEVDKDTFVLTKEMHLSRLHNPHGNVLREHYCRRWVSLTILKDLEKIQKETPEVSRNLLCKAQISEYQNTNSRYLVISIAKPSPPQKDTNASISIGFGIDDNLKSIVNFLNDPSLIHNKVNETCERCGIMDCTSRASEPTVLTKLERMDRIKTTIDAMN
ncbi:MAG: helix-turn-helix domain-containing protein [Spirosomataceae bacterium]